MTLEYCTDDDVKNACPEQMKVDPKLPNEIIFWKKFAQGIINDLLSPTYETPLEFIPDGVRLFTALMTVSLLLSNPLTKYNTKETQEDKVVTLAQLRESQAMKLVKNLINQKSFDSRVVKRKSENSRSNLVRIGTISQIRDIGTRDYI